MIVYNYTRVKKREKKTYSIFDTTVSSNGFSVRTVKTCTAMLFLFALVGVPFCLISGTFWYNPIHILEGTSAGYFYFVFIFAPIGLGIALNSTKIQNYKAIDYLKIYFAPKAPLNQEGKKIKTDEFKIDTFVERIK